MENNEDSDERIPQKEEAGETPDSEKSTEVEDPNASRTRDSGASLANLERDVLSKTTGRPTERPVQPGAVSSSPTGQQLRSNLRQMEADVEAKRRGTHGGTTRPGAVSVPAGDVAGIDAQSGVSSSLSSLERDVMSKNAARNQHSSTVPGAQAVSGISSLQQLEHDALRKGQRNSGVSSPGVVSVSGSSSLQALERDVMRKGQGVSGGQTPGAQSVSGAASLQALEQDVMRKGQGTAGVSSPGAVSVSGASSLQALEQDVMRKGQGVSGSVSPGARSIGGAASLQALEQDVMRKGQRTPGMSSPGAVSVSGTSSLQALEQDVMRKGQGVPTGASPGAKSIGGAASLQALEQDVMRKGQGNFSGALPGAQPVSGAASLQALEQDMLNKGQAQRGFSSPGAHTVSGVESLQALEHDIVRKGQGPTPGVQSISGAASLQALEQDVVRKGHSVGGGGTPGAQPFSGSASLQALEQDVVRKGQVGGAQSAGARSISGAASLQALEQDVVRKGQAAAVGVVASNPFDSLDSPSRLTSSLQQMEQDALSKARARPPSSGQASLSQLEADVQAKARASVPAAANPRLTSLSQMEQDALSKMHARRADEMVPPVAVGEQPLMRAAPRDDEMTVGTATSARSASRSVVSPGQSDGVSVGSPNSSQLNRIGVGILTPNVPEVPPANQSEEGIIDPYIEIEESTPSDWQDVHVAAPDGHMVLAADTVLTATTAVVINEDDEKARERRRVRKKCKIMAAVVVVVAIVAAVVGVLAGGGSDGGSVVVTPAPTAEFSEAPTNAPSAAPTSSEMVELVEALRELYDDDQAFDELFQNRQSPQYKAARWMADEDTYSVDYSDAKFVQRFVLVCFYYALGGDNWHQCSRSDTTCGLGSGKTPWLRGDECGWMSVECGNGIVETIVFDSQDSITSVSEYPYGLTGTLPEEMQLLTGMTRLALDKNYIGGTIPEWSGLSSLQILKLGTNELSGSIPEQLLIQNTQLGTIELEYNSLVGTIPWDAFADTVRDIDLSANNFNGIVTSISHLTSLRDFNVESNELTGEVPLDLFKLPAIEEIRLGGNVGLTAVLGDEMFENVTTLEELSLFGALGVSGSLPPQMFNVTSLTTIEIYSCSLTGTLSEDFAKLTQLESLLLYNNQLSGSFPQAFDGLTELADLLLHNNDIYGNVSETLCDRKGLDYGDLNNFTVDCDAVTCSCCKCF